MNRRKSKLTALALIAAVALSGCSAQSGEKQPSTSQTASDQAGKLSVYTSFYPMYDFTAKVGGDKVAVTNMISPGMEAHHWEPEAADIAGLESADVFVYNGAGMEHWVEQVLSSLENKDMVVVEASEGLALNEGAAHSHDEEAEHEEAEDHDEAEDHEEDDHGDFDPHTWLSPLNAKKQMENIKDALSQADPANADYYLANYERYATELEQLDKDFRDTLSPLPNKEVIVAHKAFGYLCAEYGLTQVGVDGLVPDSEPDAARIAEVIDFAKEHNVGTIFFEELASPKVANTIADAIGAKTAVLTPIEALSDAQLAAGDDYISIMRQNLAALYEALKS